MVHVKAVVFLRKY